MKPTGPDFTSPKFTFVAQFDDGVITRMTTFCADGKLDLKRGIKLARAAYDSRKRKPSPPLTSAKFVDRSSEETTGTETVLQHYDADALK